jgi:hypothetical protein
VSAAAARPVLFDYKSGRARVRHKPL